MQSWKQIRVLIDKILEKQRYASSGKYNGEHCFLTAYQIAVLVDRENSMLKGNLSIGGSGMGPDGFARQIAKHLSADINNGLGDTLEIRFLSLAGLDTFTFDGGNTPSADEFSMFRWKNGSDSPAE